VRFASRSKILVIITERNRKRVKELENRCGVISWPTVQHHNVDKTCIEFRVFRCLIQCTPVDMYQNVCLIKEAAICSEYLPYHMASHPRREGP